MIKKGNKTSLEISLNELNTEILKNKNLEKLKITSKKTNRTENINLQVFKTVINDNKTIDKFIKIYKLYDYLKTETNKLTSVINEYDYLKKENFPDELDKIIIEEHKLKVSEKQPNLDKLKTEVDKIISEFELKFSKTDFLSNQTDFYEKLSKIKEFENLKELDLSFNYLTELPKELAKLKKLEIINLSSNYFNEIPFVLFKIKNLRHINMYDNPLNKTSIKYLLLKSKLWLKKQRFIYEKKQVVKKQNFELAKKYYDMQHSTKISTAKQFEFNYNSLFAEIL